MGQPRCGAGAGCVHITHSMCVWMCVRSDLSRGVSDVVLLEEPGAEKKAVMFLFFWGWGGGLGVAGWNHRAINVFSITLWLEPHPSLSLGCSAY